MSICIVDFLASVGHHPIYIDAVRDLQNLVGFVGHQKNAPILTSCNKNLTTITTPKEKTTPTERLELLEQYVKTYGHPREFFFLELDQIAFLMIRKCLISGSFSIAGVPVTGIWFRSNFLYREGVLCALRRFALLLAITRWARQTTKLYFLDDELARTIAGLLSEDAKNRWIKEPFRTEPKSIPSDQHPKKHTIIFPGAQAPRKGTFWALDAISTTTESFTNLKVVIAGVIEDVRIHQAIAKLRTQSIEVEVHDKYHEINQYLRLIEQSDIVMLPYFDFGGSSGVLLEAAEYQKPVIATDHGTIGRVVRTHRIGRVFAPGNKTEFVAALAKTVLDLKDLRSQADFNGVLSRCSISDFRKKVSSRDRE